MEFAVVTLLCDVVEWSVESAFSIHILTILPRDHGMNTTGVISWDMLILCRAKPTKSHSSHECNLILSLPFHIIIRDVNYRDFQLPFTTFLVPSLATTFPLSLSLPFPFTAPCATSTTVPVTKFKLNMK